MIYFIVRVAVNALALAITVFLLPGIRVFAWDEGQMPLVLTYLIMGLLFGLINALVGPLVLLITGKLLLWTMGLFTWLINSLLLLALSFVAPAIWTVEEPLFFGSSSPALQWGSPSHYWRHSLAMAHPGCQTSQRKFLN